MARRRRGLNTDVLVPVTPKPEPEVTPVEVLPPLQPEELELTTLSDRINHLHLQIGRLAIEALDYARQAGELLLVVKAQLPHGEFQGWVDQHLHCGLRQTQKYMTIAREWSLLEQAKANSNSLLGVMDALTIDKALHTIRGLKQAPPKGHLGTSASTHEVLRAYRQSVQRLLKETEQLPSLNDTKSDTKEVQQLTRELTDVLQRLKAALEVWD